MRDRDELGALELHTGDIEVGRRRRRHMRRQAKGHMRRHGAGKEWGRLQPLGLGSVTFGVATAATLQLTGYPQKLFHPQRLILSVVRNGTTSTGLVTVTAANIGADNQLVSAAGAGGIPTDVFLATGVDLNINWAIATPGIQVTVLLAISALPSSTDTVVVGGAFTGSALETSAPAANF
jgi:hypothetical protein